MDSKPVSAADHPIEVVPPQSVASPTQMPPPLPFEGDMPFWKPTWGQIALNLGWRWIFFLPLAGLLAIVVAIPFQPAWIQFFIYGGWKLSILAVGICLGLAARAVKRLVSARSEPFCIHCGYDLTGLGDGGICPECGRHFDHRMIEEYRRDPDWFIQRYRKHQNNQILGNEFRFEAGAVRRKKSRDGT